ncbi:hypothetical protein LO772_21100 [Yinghuangia sp. ASG 101]|uniref:glycoside hydrolase family 26 protein n=1 Tax=Yinghuangia sp. ASG 101 TaxID=2896848 RepID=UPI001E44E247|nr:glycosyl hydrolase [Yinghuangia sp. ASG 101]UGQ09433.1 hypothetical protein LO772_21100 [Yinghuangia sp. ASG 101]
MPDVTRIASHRPRRPTVPPPAPEPTWRRPPHLPPPAAPKGKPERRGLARLRALRLPPVTGRWRLPTTRARTGWLGAGFVGVLVIALVAVLLTDDGSPDPHDTATVRQEVRSMEGALLRRDPMASPAAQSVYALLARMETAARAGTSEGTVIGQHVEIHNERNNPFYGDYRGTKPPGYYYGRVGEIAGLLPGFVEVDLGPGYGDSNWGVGDPRWYSEGKWPTCREEWQYTNDAVDLLHGVWNGVPRGSDGRPQPRTQCDGTTSTLPDNGARPSGMVGMSFHEPYPGSPVKAYDQMMCANSPAAKDPTWFGRVVDFTANTPEYQALLTDLAFLADHLAALARDDVPVLLRPYHEMNATGCGGFWWAGQQPEQFKALWRIMYDYLVTTRGLHNLVFVWSPSGWDGKRGTEPWAYYPGEQYVDVVGIDDYSDSPEAPYGDGSWTEEWYRGLADYGKPRMLAETFHMPVNRFQQDTLARTPWVIWNVWGQAVTETNLSEPTGKNTAEDVRATYRSPLAITGGTPGGAPVPKGVRAPFDWLAVRKP